MVNVTYSPEGNPIYTQPDGTEALYNLGDMSWIIVSTAREWRVRDQGGGSRADVACARIVVWWMIPGVGFLYSGLLRRKNALSMLLLSLCGLGVGR